MRESRDHIAAAANDAGRRLRHERAPRAPSLARRFEPPDEATIRRVLETVDASALDAAVGSWLGARLRAAGQGQGHGLRQRRSLAVDGKAVRGTRHSSSDGQAVHLLGVIDQQARAVLAQAAVDGKTNEITAFAPLLEDPGHSRGRDHGGRYYTPSASTRSSWSATRRRITSWS